MTPRGGQPHQDKQHRKPSCPTVRDCQRLRDYHGAQQRLDPAEPPQPGSPEAAYEFAAYAESFAP